MHEWMLIRSASNQIFGLNPPELLHGKAAEQVAGVICHTSRAGFSTEQQVAKIRRKHCVSVNWYTKACDISWKSVINTGEAADFHGNTVEAPWCSTERDAFPFITHSCCVCGCHPLLLSAVAATSLFVWARLLRVIFFFFFSPAICAECVSKMLVFWGWNRITIQFVEEL